MNSASLGLLSALVVAAILFVFSRRTSTPRVDAKDSPLPQEIKSYKYGLPDPDPLHDLELQHAKPRNRQYANKVRHRGHFMFQLTLMDVTTGNPLSILPDDGSSAYAR
jgi:hypothetical protein